MHAVVLVGGFGTRLRPLTDRVPKPMLRVVGRPMIERLVDRLAAGGVTDVVLALGFQPEPFYDAFPGGVHHGVHLHYAVEPEPLDTGGAIAFAARSVGVDDTFVVGNGDVITSVPTAELVDAHRRSGCAATIHLTPVDDPSAFGVVEAASDGVVERFVEKPAPGETDSNLINAGTYVFEPEVLDLIEPHRRVSIEREVFPRLVADRRLAALATDHYWIDAGRPDLFRRANLDLISGRYGEPECARIGDARVDPTATVSNTVVDRATVLTHARVADSVLLPGAIVEAGAHVRRSIVAGRVGAGAVLTDVVVGADQAVQPGRIVADRNGA